MPKFLREHAIEPNSRQRYAEVLRSHAVPYIGHRRVAEISRETLHRLLTVVLKDEGVGQPSILYARTALSAMMQMAWGHGYREDNPLRVAREDLGRRGLHRRGCHRNHTWRRGLENRRRQCERP